MPHFIVINSTKNTDFDNEAKTVLESNKFSLLHTGTYAGTSSASTVATKLKNLKSYTNNRVGAGIIIYYGTLNKC